MLRAGIVDPTRHLNAMNRLDQIIRWIAAMQLALAAIAVLGILMTVALDISLRAMANASFSSTIEIVSFYYMIPLAFFPIATLELTDGHIDTDLFFLLFPPLIKALAILVAGGLAVAIYSVLTFVTFNQAIVSTRTNELAMGVNLLPIWPVRWVLPVAFGSGTLAAVLLTVRHLVSEQRDV